MAVNPGPMEDWSPSEVAAEEYQRSLDISNGNSVEPLVSIKKHK